MSLKINKVPKEIPTKCEFLIFKNLRTSMISSQAEERLKSKSKKIDESKKKTAVKKKTLTTKKK